MRSEIDGATSQNWFVERKMKKVDSALSELSLTINTVRSTQLAIERSGLILPAFRQRLQRVKWWLDGDIQLSLIHI